MKKLKKKIFSRKPLLALLIGCLLIQTYCAPAPSPQVPCGFVQNSVGQRISWKQNTPVKLYFDPAFPQQFRPSVINAINTWQTAIGRTVFTILGDKPGTQPSHDGISVVYWVTTAWDQSTQNSRNQQANTIVYWANNQLLEADMMVNGNFTYSTQASGAEIDIESLILHELGHVLGLKHVTDQVSVMNAQLAPATNRRQLYGIDTSDIKCEY